MCGWSRRAIEARELAALFDVLGLTAHRAHFPGELSLGLARRVALARAFAVKPELLLLDEPFVSLDQALAARLRDELVTLVDRYAVITLLVTHDIDEAVRLADRLILLSPRPARMLADMPTCHAAPVAHRGRHRSRSRRRSPTVSWRLGQPAVIGTDGNPGEIAMRIVLTALVALAARRLRRQCAQDRRGTRFWNLTANTVQQFYLSPAGKEEWGPDQCKNDRDGEVDHNERLRITGVSSGRYDAKLVDERRRTASCATSRSRTARCSRSRRRTSRTARRSSVVPAQAGHPVCWPRPEPP